MLKVVHILKEFLICRQRKHRHINCIKTEQWISSCPSYPWWPLQVEAASSTRSRWMKPRNDREVSLQVVVEIFFLGALLCTPGLFHVTFSSARCCIFCSVPSRQAITIVCAYLSHMFCAAIFTNGFLYVLRQYSFLAEVLSLLATFTHTDVSLLE